MVQWLVDQFWNQDSCHDNFFIWIKLISITFCYVKPSPWYSWKNFHLVLINVNMKAVLYMTNKWFSELHLKVYTSVWCVHASFSVLYVCVCTLWPMVPVSLDICWYSSMVQWLVDQFWNQDSCHDNFFIWIKLISITFCYVVPTAHVLNIDNFLWLWLINDSVNST
jgi:hypothetical protein